MKQDYDIDYCTLNHIPEYRQNYIALRLSWLIELLHFNNNHLPIDYMELLEDIKALQPFPFEYSFIDLSEKYDALTEYVEEHSLHIIFVNRNKVNYPLEHPTYKKLTFAIARELAHIILGHLLIPHILKTSEEINIEQIEADEFASRFLNAGAVGFSYNHCHPRSSDESALYQRQLIRKV
ncbi:ImmA/IrrE family metallo-endopeptidase [Candidatus Clostridium stratigraminis]|uniref:ImmA/IrrE family metallo-endopeptidase n=1 Tax=Candidatus Clostridium stratigraminis TaxID=3381661 RepID=A0ABW8T6A1_9CLOT